MSTALQAAISLCSMKNITLSLNHLCLNPCILGSSALNIAYIILHSFFRFQAQILWSREFSTLVNTTCSLDYWKIHNSTCLKWFCVIYNSFPVRSPKPHSYCPFLTSGNTVIDNTTCFVCLLGIVCLKHRYTVYTIFSKQYKYSLAHSSFHFCFQNLQVNTI